MDVLKITISSPEKVEGGLFSSAYVTYLVTTHPLNYVVRRRYSDFEWLRKILYTLYPGVPVITYLKRFLLFLKSLIVEGLMNNL